MAQSPMADPAVVHETLCALAKKRAGADCELGQWLLAAERTAVHLSLGYASIAEYIERLFGFSRRQAHERLRVARALETLPHLAEALRTGEKPFSVIRELTRVANEKTEEEWNRAATGRSAREVERMVARHAPGDLPTDPPRPERTRKLVLEVSAPTWALFEEAWRAVTAVRGRRPPPLCHPPQP